MKNFLQRVLPGVFGKSTPDLTHPSQIDAPVTQPGANSTDPVRWTAGVRRPLLSAHGEVVGFEFRISNSTRTRLEQRTDHRAQSSHVSATLTSARMMAQAGRVGLALLPAHWLQHTALTEVGAEIWVGLEFTQATVPEPGSRQTMVEAIQRLRTCGAKVGWDTSQDLGLAPDFVLLHQGAATIPTLLNRLKTLPGDLQQLPAVITDIAGLEDFELALNHTGITYLCGALASIPAGQSAKEAGPIPPKVQNVALLLNKLMTGADTDVIVQDIKGDVSLSYDLLRRLNSASFAQLETGASIDKAVLMLGRNELYRWLSMLLMQFGGKRKASIALQEIALWRSRLLELLAQEAHEVDPGRLFTLGLASMLGPILNVSLSDVVNTLNLPPQARAALLEQSGAWHVYLHIAEQVCTQQAHEDMPLADFFGGGAHVHALSAQAWAWAAEHVNKGG